MSESIMVLGVECHRDGASRSRIWRGSTDDLRVTVGMGDPVCLIATWQRDGVGFYQARTIEVHAVTIEAAEARMREVMAAPLPEAQQ